MKRKQLGNPLLDPNRNVYHVHWQLEEARILTGWKSGHSDKNQIVLRAKNKKSAFCFTLSNTDCALLQTYSPMSDEIKRSRVSHFSFIEVKLEKNWIHHPKGNHGFGDRSRVRCSHQHLFSFPCDTRLVDMSQGPLQLTGPVPVFWWTECE